jgi:hypothetical protein
MRWNSLVSLLSDSRVSFLLGFVIVVILFAVILALVELKLKRKKEKVVIKSVEELAIDKIKKFMKYNKSSRDKLDFIDKNAKEYFHEMYGTSLKSNYSTLIKELSKHQLKHDIESSENKTPIKISILPDKEEVVFCRSMQAAYYFVKKLKSENVNALADLLINIKEHKRVIDKIPIINFSLRKKSKIFTRLINIFFLDKKIPIKKNIKQPKQIVRKDKIVKLPERKKIIIPLKDKNTPKKINLKFKKSQKEKVAERVYVLPSEVKKEKVIEKVQVLPSNIKKEKLVLPKINKKYRTNKRKFWFFKNTSRKDISKIRKEPYNIVKTNPSVINIKDNLVKNKLEPVKKRSFIFFKNKNKLPKKKKQVTIRVDKKHIRNDKDVFTRRHNSIKNGRDGVAGRIVKHEKTRLNK